MFTLHGVLSSLVRGEPLGEDGTRWAFEELLCGRMDDASIGAMLALIQARGATVGELVGGARAMREHVTPIETPDGARVLDTCGTGGTPKAFNISTAAAIVIAAAGREHGVVVAKHGNRSRSGRGSAEILESLSVNVGATPAQQARCLREAGVSFSFAIHHHPAMKHAAGPRRSLGFPTIFNLLGPLTNPAGARRQLLGVYAPELVEVMASALLRLGAERAMVVHASDGLDEITLTGTTHAAIVDAGQVRLLEIDPRHEGLACCAPASLRVDTLDAARDAIVRVIDGDARDENARARLECVLLNAGAGLMVGGACETLRKGVAMARDAVTSGAARQTLDALGRVSHEAA
ncbi:MAG: anthranilate phosphoribosyltransferase [Phycisphaerales bacterium]|jgi:anthranilate phosphoribosyltransferase|nr:anthranilate phosphoribosyltransferase [Phycisphaerales bacterium]